MADRGGAAKQDPQREADLPQARGRERLSQPSGYFPPAHQMPTVEVRGGHPERGSATCTASLPPSLSLLLSVFWCSLHCHGKHA